MPGRCDNCHIEQKPKYQGGLVFEPERGCIKIMFGYGFQLIVPKYYSRVQHMFHNCEQRQINVTHDENKDMPILPERDTESGVLPRLLNTLVSRRRELRSYSKILRILHFKSSI